jgi:Cu(I)/Ag(I) efflux system membrane fusion protein
MTRPRIASYFALGIAALGGIGFITSRAIRETRPTPNSASHDVSSAASGPIIYYRDPDGRPSYSATPKKSPEGKDYTPVHSSEDFSFEEKAPVKTAAPNSERRVRFYRHPMGLPDTSPVPKKDTMGMDYVPVYEDEAQDTSIVTISQGKLQKAGVRSEPVERRALSVPVRATGKIEFDPRRLAIVSFRFEGFIEAIEKVAEGDFVRKGQPLMRVYSPTVSSAAAELVAVLNAGRSGMVSKERLDGARRRLANLGLDDKAIAAIARARAVPRTIAWPAPQDGHILERSATSGMRSAPGDVLFRIVDHSSVWVLADVAERDIGMISPGQAVSVRPRAFPDRVFNGKVALIYPHLNTETRTARVRIELPNPDGQLRGDMYADVEIASGRAGDVIAVPESAIIDTGKRQVVIVDKGEGRFEPREVTVGRRGDGFVEIQKGVDEKDRVVTSANFLIDAESNLKAALRGLDQMEVGK